MTNHFPAKSLIWETDRIFTVTHGGSLAYWATEFDNNRNVDWWYVEDGSPFTYSMLLASTGVLSGILRAGATVATDSIEIFEIFGTDFWIDLFEEGAFKAPFVDDPAKGSVDEVNLSLPLSQSFKDIYSQVLSEYDNYIALDFEKANKWDAINFTDVVSELIWDWEVGELALFLMGWPESGFFADAIGAIAELGFDAAEELFDIFDLGGIIRELRIFEDIWDHGLMAYAFDLADILTDGLVHEVMNDAGDQILSTVFNLNPLVLVDEAEDDRVFDIFPITPPSDLTFMSMPMAQGGLGFPPEDGLLPFREESREAVNDILWRSIEIIWGNTQPKEILPAVIDLLVESTPGLAGTPVGFALQGLADIATTVSIWNANVYEPESWVSEQFREQLGNIWGDNFLPQQNLYANNPNNWRLINGNRVNGDEEAVLSRDKNLNLRTKHVVTHEIGHSMGLPHTGQFNAQGGTFWDTPPLPGIGEGLPIINNQWFVRESNRLGLNTNNYADNILAWQEVTTAMTHPKAVGLDSNRWSQMSYTDPLMVNPRMSISGASSINMTVPQLLNSLNIGPSGSGATANYRPFRFIKPNGLMSLEIEYEDSDDSSNFLFEFEGEFGTLVITAAAADSEYTVNYVLNDDLQIDGFARDKFLVTVNGQSESLEFIITAANGEIPAIAWAADWLLIDPTQLALFRQPSLAISDLNKSLKFDNISAPVFDNGPRNHRVALNRTNEVRFFTFSSDSSYQSTGLSNFVGAGNSRDFYIDAELTEAVLINNDFWVDVDSGGNYTYTLDNNLPVPWGTFTLPTGAANELILAPTNSNPTFGEFVVTKSSGSDSYQLDWRLDSSISIPQGTKIREELIITLPDSSRADRSRIEDYGQDSFKVFIEYVSLDENISPVRLSHEPKIAYYEQRENSSGNTHPLSTNTIGPLDLEALHTIYGVELKNSSSESNNIYRWDPVEAASFQTLWDLNGIDEIDASRHQSGTTLDLRGGVDKPSSMGSVETISTARFTRDDQGVFSIASNDENYHLSINGILNSAGKLSEKMLPGSASNDANLFIYYLDYDRLFAGLELRRDIFGSQMNRYTDNPLDINEIPIQSDTIELHLGGGEEDGALDSLLQYLSGNYTIEIATGSQASDTLITHGPIDELPAIYSSREFTDGIVAGMDGNDTIILSGPRDMGIGGGGNDHFKLLIPDQTKLLKLHRMNDGGQNRVGQLAVGGSGDDTYEINDLGSAYHIIMSENFDDISGELESVSIDNYVSDFWSILSSGRDVINRTEAAIQGLLDRVRRQNKQSFVKFAGSVYDSEDTRRDLIDDFSANRLSSILNISEEYASITDESLRSSKLLKDEFSIKQAIAESLTAFLNAYTGTESSSDNNTYDLSIQSKLVLGEPVEDNITMENTYNGFFAGNSRGYQSLFRSSDEGLDTLNLVDSANSGPGLFVDGPGGIVRYTMDIGSDVVEQVFSGGGKTPPYSVRYSSTPDLLSPLVPYQKSLTSRTGKSSFEKLIFRSESSLSNQDVIVGSVAQNNVETGDGNDAFFDPRYVPLGYTSNPGQMPSVTQIHAKKYYQIDAFSSDYAANVDIDDISNQFLVLLHSSDLRDIDSTKWARHGDKIFGGLGDLDLLSYDLRSVVPSEASTSNINIDLTEINGSQLQLSAIPDPSRTEAIQAPHISQFEWFMSLAGTEFTDNISADINSIVNKLWKPKLIEDESDDDKSLYMYTHGLEYLQDYFIVNAPLQSGLMLSNSGLIETSLGADKIDLGRPDWRRQSFNSLALSFGYGDRTKPHYAHRNGLPVVIDMGNDIPEEADILIETDPKSDQSITVYQDQLDYDLMRTSVQDTFSIDLSLSPVPVHINEDRVRLLEYNDMARFGVRPLGTVSEDADAESRSFRKNQAGSDLISAMSTPTWMLTEYSSSGLFNLNEFEKTFSSTISVDQLLNQLSDEKLKHSLESLAPVKELIDDFSQNFGIYQGGSRSKSLRDNNEADYFDIINFDKHLFKIKPPEGLTDEEMGEWFLNPPSSSVATVERFDLSASKFNDILDGGYGDDRLFGLNGHDVIAGNYGNDYISGGYGYNFLDGGPGEDCLILESSIDSYSVYRTNSNPLGGINPINAYIFYSTSGDKVEMTFAKDFECIEFSDGTLSLDDSIFQDLVIGSAVMEPQPPSVSNRPWLLEPLKPGIRPLDVPEPEHPLPTLPVPEIDPFPPHEFGVYGGLDASAPKKLVESIFDDYSKQFKVKPQGSIPLFNSYLDFSGSKLRNLDVDMNTDSLLKSWDKQLTFPAAWGITGLFGSNKSNHVQGNNDENVVIVGALKDEVNLAGGDDILFVNSSQVGSYSLEDGNDIFFGSNVADASINMGKNNDIAYLSGFDGLIDSGSGADLIVASNNTSVPVGRLNSEKIQKTTNNKPKLLLNDGNDRALLDGTFNVFGGSGNDAVYSVSGDLYFESGDGDDDLYAPRLHSYDQISIIFDGGLGDDSLYLNSTQANELNNVKFINKDRHLTLSLIDGRQFSLINVDNIIFSDAEYEPSLLLKRFKEDQSAKDVLNEYNVDDLLFAPSLTARVDNDKINSKISSNKDSDLLPIMQRSFEIRIEGDNVFAEGQSSKVKIELPVSFKDHTLDWYISGSNANTDLLKDFTANKGTLTLNKKGIAYLDIQPEADMLSDGNTDYTLYLKGRSFNSNLEVGAWNFQVIDTSRTDYSLQLIKNSDTFTHFIDDESSGFVVHGKNQSLHGNAEDNIFEVNSSKTTSYGRSGNDVFTNISSGDHKYHGGHGRDVFNLDLGDFTSRAHIKDFLPLADQIYVDGFGFVTASSERELKKLKAKESLLESLTIDFLPVSRSKRVNLKSRNLMKFGSRFLESMSESTELPYIYDIYINPRNKNTTLSFDPQSISENDLYSVILSDDRLSASAILDIKALTGKGNKYLSKVANQFSKTIDELKLVGGGKADIVIEITPLLDARYAETFLVTKPLITKKSLLLRDNVVLEDVNWSKVNKKRTLARRLYSSIDWSNTFLSESISSQLDYSKIKLSKFDISKMENPNDFPFSTLSKKSKFENWSSVPFLKLTEKSLSSIPWEIVDFEKASLSPDFSISIIDWSYINNSNNKSLVNSAYQLISGKALNSSPEMIPHLNLELMSRKQLSIFGDQSLELLNKIPFETLGANSKYFPWHKINYSDLDTNSLMSIDWPSVNYSKAQLSDEFTLDIVDWDSVNSSDAIENIYNQISWNEFSVSAQVLEDLDKNYLPINLHFSASQKDKLIGGEGVDRFVFTDLRESLPGLIWRDEIVNFNVSEGDVIDASILTSRANSSSKIDFIEELDFTGMMPEIRFANSVLQLDLYGNGKADLEVALPGVKVLASENLIV